MDSEIIDELLSRVTHGFDMPNSPNGLRNNPRTGVTGDTWISTAQTALRDSEIIKELLSHVTHGFDIYSPNSRRDSEIINELL
jgi:hypothetical protein